MEENERCKENIKLYEEKRKTTKRISQKHEHYIKSIMSRRGIRLYGRWRRNFQ